MGEYEPDLVPGQTLRDRHQAAGDHPARRAVVRGRRQRDPLAELGVPAGLQLPRGPGHPSGQVQRPRHRTGHRLPHVVRRDDRALPGSQLRPLPPHRLRHRRVGPGLHDHLARALGCDCLGEIRYVDAVLTDSLGEPSTIANAICLHEEDNAVLWKHIDSINGRAEVRRAAADGGLHPRHRGQLRVPGLLALLPGRQHRVRGAGDRDHGHHADSPRARRPRPPGRWSTSAPTPRTTSTSWWPGWTWTSTAGTTRCWRSTRKAAPIGPDNPYGLAVVTKATPDRVRVGIGPRLQLGDPARLEGGQPGEAQRARHAGGLQAGARRGVPGDDGPVDAAVPAGAGDGPHAVGDPPP